MWDLAAAHFMPFEKTARNQYTEPVERDSAGFVHMLLMDGIFVFQTMIDAVDKAEGRYNSEMDDWIPIRTKVWQRQCISEDLQLLENQLPTIIIREIHKLVHARMPDQLLPLEEIICKYFDLGTHKAGFKSDDQHLLDMIRLQSLPTSIEKYSSGGKKFLMSRCATKLYAAGVIFKHSVPVNRTSVLDIKFNIASGVLEIPSLVFSSQFEQQMRNLMAYEVNNHPLESYIVDYIRFLDGLIDTAEDVDLLEQQGIITNWAGSSEAVATMVNNLTQGIPTYPASYLTPICQQLDEYSKKSTHRWMATLWREYFGNPWTIISLVAAVILLILTFMQTANSFISL